MKKLLLLAALFTAFSVTNVSAQGGMSPEQRAERQKQTKVDLVSKAKVSEAEADKIMQIQQDSRAGMRGLRDLSVDDRKKKMDEIKLENEKKFKAIPLTDEQLKAVSAYYDEQTKRMMERAAGN